MKEIVKTSRLAGQLEKLFRMLNEDMFEGQLETPIITIQSTPRAYGHYSVSKIWTVNGEESKHEINIGAGQLDREIEYTVATLLHEMCHMYNDTVLNIQDCSRGGTYHNKQFKATAESVGLIVTNPKNTAGRTQRRLIACLSGSLTTLTASTKSRSTATKAGYGLQAAITPATAPA